MIDGFISKINVKICRAKLVIELAKLKNFVQATAILHPSFVTLDDIKGMLRTINTLSKLVDHS